MNKSTQNENNDTLFFEALMNNIMEGTKTPKVQIERVVGPILGFFIEDIISTLLEEDVVTISAEFPLRKFVNAGGIQNNHSTNIDWLMYSREKKELIFVELKTTDTSFSRPQASLYAKVQQEINSKRSALFLERDIKTIKSASKESGKYESILKKIEKESIDFSEIHGSRIIYILPDVVKRKMQEKDKEGIEFYPFKDLRINANKKNAFRSQWLTLFKHLCALDEITRKSRNSKTKKDAT